MAEPQAPLPFAWGVLYAKPNPDGTPKRCDNCMMWSWKDQRCSIHAANLEVPPASICGYHVFGQPMETRPTHPGLDPVDPELSGFDTEVGEGTYCGSCVFYEPTSEDKGLCHGVAAAGGDPPQPVDYMGCCARWEATPLDNGGSMGRSASGYVVVDAEVRAAESPNFNIPSPEDRQSLRPGDLAKLIFEILEVAGQHLTGERMWVEIKEVGPEGYMGVLANTPAVIESLQMGDTIIFGPENVIQIMLPEE